VAFELHSWKGTFLGEFIVKKRKPRRPLLVSLNQKALKFYLGIALIEDKSQKKSFTHAFFLRDALNHRILLDQKI
jgi:hypothetical protein